MYVKINNVNYRNIKQLSFDPQTDIRGSEVAINEFSVHIITSDRLSVGMNALLYDDRDVLWANYWVTFAEQVDEHTFSVVASSQLVLLARKKLPAVMYSNASVPTVIASLFSDFGNIYTLDSSFASDTVDGFCPEQSAKDRLQWICMVIGAYIKTSFTDKIELVPIDVNTEYIRPSEVFWKPSVAYRDYVTAVKVRAYTFTQGTPQTTDEWVSDGTNYYIQTVQDFSLTNSDVPSGTPENVVEINDVTLINTDNVAAIVSHLAALYFKRIDVTADVINNGQYAAGDRVIIPLDEEFMVDGFIESCSFTFGLQSKSQIKVLQMDTVTGTTLIMIYYYDGVEIGRKSYVLPLNYHYDIQNPFLDRMEKKRRIIYRPLEASSTGIVDESPTYDEVDYDIALDYSSKKLKIYSVDEVDQSGSVVEVT